MYRNNVKAAAASSARPFTRATTINENKVPSVWLRYLIAYALMVLWFHTGLDKYGDLWEFQVELSRQPLPAWAIKPLTHAVPAVELIARGLLFFPVTQRIGYWFSTVLMLAFTVYVLLGVNKILGHLPCSCSKIITGLSWKQHLIFNSTFLLLALTGLSFHYWETTRRIFMWFCYKLRMRTQI